jgi:hypothetical protein
LHGFYRTVLPQIKHKKAELPKSVRRVAILNTTKARMQAEKVAAKYLTDQSKSERAKVNTVTAVF